MKELDLMWCNIAHVELWMTLLVSRRDVITLLPHFSDTPHLQLRQFVAINISHAP